MRFVRRAVAVTGAGAVIGAAAAASVAQRTSPASNFISELGVPGRPLAWMFRTGEAAAALACVHVGLTSIRSSRRASRQDGPDPVAEGKPACTAHVRRSQDRLTGAVARAAGGELRGLALTAAGGSLLVAAMFPSAPGSLVPLRDGTVPTREWMHVPAATAAFYLWPMAADGRLRALLVVNLLLLAPPTMVDPHGPAAAVLQRTMAVLAAAALASWTPTSPATAARNRRGGR